MKYNPSECYPVTEKLYVSKKTEKMYLRHKDQVNIDMENPVERDLSEFKPAGGNNIFSIYEKTEWKRYDGKPFTNS